MRTIEQQSTEFVPTVAEQQLSVLKKWQWLCLIFKIFYLSVNNYLLIISLTTDFNPDFNQAKSALLRKKEENVQMANYIRWNTYILHFPVWAGCRLHILFYWHSLPCLCITIRHNLILYFELYVFVLYPVQVLFRFQFRPSWFQMYRLESSPGMSIKST